VRLFSFPLVALSVAADHRAHGVIRPEILGAIDIEQGGELRARGDAALDGPDAQPQIVAASS